ncbi:insulinase family protein [bacterium]|nr:insulinase family protein [bacterium]
MNRKILRGFIFVVFLIPFVLWGQKHYKELTYPSLGTIEMPEKTTVTLNNGMKLILIEDHELPFIKMRAEFFTGSYWGDPDDQAGLACITGEVMRTGGSTQMSGDEIDEELESIAASIETWINQVSGGASVSALKDHFDKVAEIFADVLRDPEFPDDKIELAKVQEKSAISRRNDNPGEIAQREFYKLIYKNCALYRDEEYATIDAITRDDIVNFHKKWVRPNGMVIGIWGDFKTGTMISKLKNLFEDWQPVPDPVEKKVTVPYQYEYSVNLVEKTDVNQSNIYIGHLGGTKKIGPNNHSEDYAAILMMNQILGGGLSSRLFSRVRSDQGLAYAVYGGCETRFLYPGAFYTHSSTQSGRTVEAIRAMLKEIRLMTEKPVTEEELTRAKEGWLNSYVFNFDQVGEIAARLVQYAYNNYPDDFLQQARQNVEKVTREDVLRVAQTYLKPDQVHILVVGNSSDFDEPLSVLGNVNTIDITIPAPEEKIEDASAENLEKGKQLILKMAEAMGGLDKITAVQNTYSRAKIAQTSPMGEMAMDVQRTVVYPDKVFMELNMPMGLITMVLEGGNARMSGPQGTMPAPEAVENQLTEDFFRDTIVLLKNLNERDIQFVEEASFSEKKALEIIIRKDDMMYRLFLDGETMLPLGMKYNTVTQQGPARVTEYFHDYRDVDGIQTAFKVTAYTNDEKSSDMLVTEFQYNADVDMSVFSEK